MKYDIHTLSRGLEQVCREGAAAEQTVLEWKLAEAKKPSCIPESPAS